MTDSEEEEEKHKQKYHIRENRKERTAENSFRLQNGCSVWQPAVTNEFDVRKRMQEDRWEEKIVVEKWERPKKTKHNS